MINVIFKILKTNKIKTYIFVLSFLIFVINILSLSVDLTKNKLEREIINKEENRIMYITSDDSKDKYELISSFQNIQEVYYNIEPFLVKCHEFNSCYFRYFNSKLKLDIKLGKKSDLGYNEIIIPETILNRYNKNIDDIINKKIAILIENQEIELTISGIYSNGNQEEYIYISNDNDINKYIKNKNKYIVLIDDIKNYDKVEKFLNDNGFYIDFVDDSLKNEKQTYQDIINVLGFFASLCYLFLLFVYFALLLVNIVEKKYNIALLKTFGYSNIFILNILLLIFIIISLCSFIISILIIKLVDLLLMYIFDIKNFWNSIVIIKNFYMIFMILLLTIFFSMNKIREISIIKLLKN